MQSDRDVRPIPSFTDADEERTMHHPAHHRRRVRVHAPLAVLAATIILTLGVTGSLAGASPMPRHGSGPKPTIVLVHGAFADASSWSGVVERLQRKGYEVIAPANPLRGLAADATYLSELLGTIQGPVVLVGHSYGGMVMTNAATGNPNVRALVYIAAFAPDAGDTVAGLASSVPGSLLGPATLTIRPYTKPDGSPSAEGYLTPSEYRAVFAADVPGNTAATLAASQRPADLAILSDPSGEPAWRTIPSWYMVAKQDRTIPAGAERAMAQHAGATTVEFNGSHSVAVAHPAAVVDLVVAADRATD
jgi:pimeloyl-ACP methyl ester carboxylesterase